MLWRNSAAFIGLTLASTSYAASAAAEEKGEIAIAFTYAATTTQEVLDADGSWLKKTEINQSAEMTCPVFNEGSSPYSLLDQLDPSAEDPAVGEYLIWSSEGCVGSMTANNRVTLSKGGTVKRLESVSGVRPFSASVDANVTAETDLKNNATRIWIVAPDAEGFPREGLDGKTTATLTALPDGDVISGPHPGPLKNGSFEKSVSGGSYKIEWIFTRK